MKVTHKRTESVSTPPPAIFLYIYMFPSAVPFRWSFLFFCGCTATELVSFFYARCERDAGNAFGDAVVIRRRPPAKSAVTIWCEPP